MKCHYRDNQELFIIKLKHQSNKYNMYCVEYEEAELY